MWHNQKKIRLSVENSKLKINPLAVKVFFRKSLMQDVSLFLPSLQSYAPLRYPLVIKRLSFPPRALWATLTVGPVACVCLCGLCVCVRARMCVCVCEIGDGGGPSASGMSVGVCVCQR